MSLHERELLVDGQPHEGLGSWSTWHDPGTPIRVGVSRCLLGENVRYDRGHARDRFVTDVLARWIEWADVCPEVDVGMGVPRPSVRLVAGDSGEPRLVEPRSGTDWTDRMRAYADAKARELDALGLDGFVVKKNSPSCGLARIRLFQGDHLRSKDERGLFTRRLLELYPLLPVEEEGRLHDPPIRETFIECLFARNRWRVLRSRGLDRPGLVAFHTAHKLLLWSHDEAGMRALGRLLGSAGSLPDDELFSAYERGFHETMARPASRGRHVNVLQHALGHFKHLLDARTRRELLGALEDYQRGWLPLVVPLALLRYEVARHEVAYLASQLYFDPHPKELLLRNHA